MEEIRGLAFKNKKALAFGCFGWSGESVKLITDLLHHAGFDVVDDGIKVLWNPDEEARRECVEFGKKACALLR